MRFKAFTMIELMVAVAIVALATSMLVPALDKARDAAKRTQSGSQMRGLGMALFMYAADNNDFSPARANNPVGNVPNAWHKGGPGKFNSAYAGDSIWTQGVIQGAGWPGTGGENFQSGFGFLFPRGYNATGPLLNDAIWGDYAEIDMVFSPNDRGPTREQAGNTYASMWALRDWFGQEFEFNFVRAGLPESPCQYSGTSSWMYYTQGANDSLQVSYAFRGADYTFYDPSIKTTQMLGYQTPNHGAEGNWGVNAMTEAAVADNAQRGKVSHPHFNGKTIVIDNSPWLDEWATPGLNVMYGDASVEFWEPDMQNQVVADLVERRIDHWWGPNSATWGITRLPRLFVAIDYQRQ